MAATVDGGPPAQALPTLLSSPSGTMRRSEEHTSELQSLVNLVCRLLLEKKKKLKKIKKINKKLKKKKHIYS